MKFYLKDILPKIERFSKRLDIESVLTKHKWIFIDERENILPTYIFQNNGSLLISLNGNVTKAKWELVNFGNILIENNSNSYLYNFKFLDTDILILNKDRTDTFSIFVSNVLHQKGINNLSKIKKYLTGRYINTKTSLKNHSQPIYIKLSNKSKIEVTPFN